jgi:hypothetical protein
MELNNIKSEIDMEIGLLSANKVDKMMYSTISHENYSMAFRLLFKINILTQLHFDLTEQINEQTEKNIV